MVERLRTALARDIIGGDRPLGRRRQRACGGRPSRRRAGATSARGAGTKTVGVNRIQIDPGKWSTPLPPPDGARRRSSTSSRAPASACRTAPLAVRPGDCIVHRVRQAHSLRADADGLDVLVFGTRGDDRDRPSPARRRRLDRRHLGRRRRWRPPWEREVEAGEPEVPELGERPANVVDRDDVEGELRGPMAPARARCRRGAERAELGDASTSATRARRRTVHSAEEEIFVVLEGEGVLELWPTPQPARDGLELRGARRSARATSSRVRPARASRTASARASPG